MNKDRYCKSVRGLQWSVLFVVTITTRHDQWLNGVAIVNTCIDLMAVFDIKVKGLVF